MDVCKPLAVGPVRDTTVMIAAHGRAMQVDSIKFGVEGAYGVSATLKL